VNASIYIKDIIASMRILHILLLLPATAVVAQNVGIDIDPTAGHPSQVTPAPAVPAPGQAMNEERYRMMEEREIVANPGVPQVPTQVNPTTTLWEPTSLAGGKVVMVPTVFIQTFAAVPDQWPLPVSGAIGLGTLTSEGTIPAATATAEARALDARSEGILGQTPWIGMAVGLACTTFAAVMLG
jgi:Killer toxin-resistance protein 1